MIFNALLRSSNIIFKEFFLIFIFYLINIIIKINSFNIFYFMLKGKAKTFKKHLNLCYLKKVFSYIRRNSFECKIF